MGVTRVGTVCVVLCLGDEERRVRGTGGVCRCGGDRGVEPLGINILVQLPRGSFNVVQRSRNRTRIRTRTEQCPLTCCKSDALVPVLDRTFVRSRLGDSYTAWLEL